jgi:hypothetical protein
VRRQAKQKPLTAEHAENSAEIAEKFNALHSFNLMIFSACSRFSLRSLRLKAFDFAEEMTKIKTACFCAGRLVLRK